MFGMPSDFFSKDYKVGLLFAQSITKLKSKFNLKYFFQSSVSPSVSSDWLQFKNAVRVCNISYNRKPETQSQN